MSKCAQCGKETPWYKLFARKTDHRQICTDCGTVKTRTQKEIRLTPKKQLRQDDPELQRLADEMDGGA
jgi:hypothetical protein